MTDHLSILLDLSDVGHAPRRIAVLLDVPLSTVYATLRKHRPHRARAPRPCTSDLPYRIAGLASKGYKPARVAELLEVSRAYVYRILAEGNKAMTADEFIEWFCGKLTEAVGVPPGKHVRVFCWSIANCVEQGLIDAHAAGEELIRQLNDPARPRVE